jgi:hypothetical protein
MIRLAAFILLWLCALTAFAEKKDKYTPCRVEWVAPTGERGHGQWVDERTAMDAAKLSAFIGIPAAVVCKRPTLIERSHPPMAKKSKLRILKDAGARQAEKMLVSRFPLNMQPTNNQLKAYAKKVADVSLARARREVKEAASVKAAEQS